MKVGGLFRKSVGLGMIVEALWFGGCATVSIDKDIPQTPIMFKDNVPEKYLNYCQGKAIKKEYLFSFSKTYNGGQEYNELFKTDSDEHFQLELFKKVFDEDFDFVAVKDETRTNYQENQNSDNTVDLSIEDAVKINAYILKGRKWPKK
jgi:hypothetical protein